MQTNINGTETNYVEIGSGPSTLLILHGWGSNLERWQEVAEKLVQHGFKVIIPDLPGFGKSEPLSYPWNSNKYVAWAEEFVSKLNLKDYYLLGHSFGGALASKIAVKHPQDIKKLFLVSAACVRKKTASKGLSAKIAKFVRILKFLPFYNLFRKAVYKFIIRKSDYVYVEGVMKDTYLNIVSEDLSFHLPFIKVPTVIIWGQKDESTPIIEAQFIAKQIKNSKLFVIPDAGHALNRQQPEALSHHILQNI